MGKKTFIIKKKRQQLNLGSLHQDEISKTGWVEPLIKRAKKKKSIEVPLSLRMSKRGGLNPLLKELKKELFVR